MYCMLFYFIYAMCYAACFITHCWCGEQAVIYKGTIDRSPIKFKLDNHHVIEKGKVSRASNMGYIITFVNIWYVLL